MLSSDDLFKLKYIHITEVEIGNNIINLGEVLEIDTYPNHINLVISRLNEKQVIKFNKEAILLVG